MRVPYPPAPLAPTPSAQASRTCSVGARRLLRAREEEREGVAGTAPCPPASGGVTPLLTPPPPLSHGGTLHAPATPLTGPLLTEVRVGVEVGVGELVGVKLGVGVGMGVGVKLAQSAVPQHLPELLLSTNSSAPRLRYLLNMETCCNSWVEC